ncbi:hypothetical protein [Actinospongicola halichondriae]|uniref:hypothetical protein n=1 Tax=Actinospongicola halichondriae TaxID=3236844 RepID=UPI003D545CE4
MSGPIHLARRFFGALSPRPLDPADDAWVHGILNPGEAGLWERMSLADRKHAAGVAREVAATLEDPGPGVLAAALLHDVGKVESRLGTVARAVATVVAAVVGRGRATGWGGDGLRGRVSGYLRHDEIGADLLAAAGSEPVTVTWAREHHLDPGRWTLDPVVATALAAADDD